MNRHARLWQVLVAIAVGSLTAACSDGAGTTGPDINPGLLDASNSVGLAAGGNLPQGSAPFTGPGGLAMDATAEEFIQQLTLQDGTVWQTSGVNVRAVPDEAVAGAPIDQLSFVSANTGSLESVPTGTYPLMGEWPVIDFIQQVKLAIARVREAGTRHDFRAGSGEFTIRSLNYFDDVYTCNLDHLTSVTVDDCYYQLGMVIGTIEFSVAMNGSTIIQQPTEFTVPIMRRTIVARLNQ